MEPLPLTNIISNYPKGKFPPVFNTPDFNCLDCGINTEVIREYYMVYDEIWESVCHKGMLCINCLEKRLNRPLTKLDFPNYPINRGSFSPKIRSIINGQRPN